MIKFSTVIWLLISCTLILNTSCQENTKHKDLEFIDSYVYTNCNIYKIFLNGEEYCFRLAFSGECDSLEFKDLIVDYNLFLDEYPDNFNLDSGKLLLFEFYKEFEFTLDNLNELKSTSERRLKCELQENRRWSQGVEFIVK